MNQYLDEVSPHTKSVAGGIISLLSAIVDSSDDAIVSKTLDGIIISWNRAAERIFGYSAAEAIGQHITLIIPPERHWEEIEVLARIRRGEKVDHYETVRQTKAGRRLYISLTVSPIKDGAGNIIGASKVARDITEHKLIEGEREELLARERRALLEVQQTNQLLKEQLEALRKEVVAREKAQAELAQAVKSRDDFIAIAAHELRNPLQLLYLTLQLLVQSSGDSGRLAQVQLLANRLRLQLERLSGLVDRLFDVTRIRMGKFELVRERVELGCLLREVVARFADQASNIRICLDQGTLIEGYWDRVRIDQAITNLLSNATKYGKKKPITVSAFIRDQHAVIIVQDRGVGISQEELGQIFDRFVQGGSGSSDHGLGLGLWITRRIVEAHGGTIVADSQLDKGSVFTIKIPLRGVS